MSQTLFLFSLASDGSAQCAYSPELIGPLMPLCDPL